MVKKKKKEEKEPIRIRRGTWEGVKAKKAVSQVTLSFLVVEMIPPPRPPPPTLALDFKSLSLI